MKRNWISAVSIKAVHQIVVNMSLWMAPFKLMVQKEKSQAHQSQLASSFGDHIHGRNWQKHCWAPPPPPPSRPGKEDSLHKYTKGKIKAHCSHMGKCSNHREGERQAHEKTKERERRWMKQVKLPQGQRSSSNTWPMVQHKVSLALTNPHTLNCPAVPCNSLEHFSVFLMAALALQLHTLVAAL